MARLASGADGRDAGSISARGRGGSRHLVAPMLLQTFPKQGPSRPPVPLLQRAPTLLPDVDSEDYKTGYQDGISGGESHAVPRDGQALADYEEGYARGHYEVTNKSTAEPSPPSATTPPPAAAPQEEEHGRFWWWLHSHGLTLTKHERADILRRGWGPESGVAVTDRDGNPVDVSRLSDDEIIALDKQLRDRPVGRAGAPIAALVWPLACDATGKLHGELPDAAETQEQLQKMSREELEQSAEELEKSIATRKAEQLRLGEEGAHRARIAQEEDLLRAIRKKLSGS